MSLPTSPESVKSTAEESNGVLDTEVQTATSEQGEVLTRFINHYRSIFIDHRKEGSSGVLGSGSPAYVTPFGIETYNEKAQIMNQKDQAQELAYRKDLSAVMEQIRQYGGIDQNTYQLCTLSLNKFISQTYRLD